MQRANLLLYLFMRGNLESLLSLFLSIINRFCIRSLANTKKTRISFKNGCLEALRSKTKLLQGGYLGEMTFILWPLSRGIIKQKVYTCIFCDMHLFMGDSCFNFAYFLYKTFQRCCLHFNVSNEVSYQRSQDFFFCASTEFLNG